MYTVKRTPSPPPILIGPEATSTFFTRFEPCSLNKNVAENVTVWRTAVESQLLSHTLR